MAKVELAGIRKKYGEVTVLHDIDLTVEDGEFVVSRRTVRLRQVDPGG